MCYSKVGEGRTTNGERTQKMVEKYQQEILDVIKEYDPEDYKSLMACPNGGIVEDHLDYIAQKYGSAKEYAKVLKAHQE